MPTEHTPQHAAHTRRPPARQPAPDPHLQRTAERLVPAPGRSAALLGDPRLGGRGNGPVRVALMRQLQQTHGNRALQRRLAGPPRVQRARRGLVEGQWAPGEAQAAYAPAVAPAPAPAPGRMRKVQRVFTGATVNTNAHLRNAGAWGTQVGARIDANSEVVIDPANTRTQVRKVFSNVNWTRAVNVAPQGWTGAMHNQGGYIRTASVAANTYPDPSPADKPPNRTSLNPKKQWSVPAGEYVKLEESVTEPGALVVKRGGAYRRLRADNTYVPLSADEQFQTDVVALKASLMTRLKAILRTAAEDEHFAGDLLSNDDHAEKLMHPLRFKEASGRTGTDFVNWYNWKEGVFPRIREGAEHLAASLVHWKNWLHPLRQAEVTINEVKLTGSDLHDEGLGAAFVTFTKPAGPPGHKFADQTNFKVVIKPEDRALEKSLFGTEATSLANRVNRMAGLEDDEAITTFKMETHANFGAILEFVRGVQPDTFDRPQPPSRALTEAMVFAFIGGLSDLHKENVLWRDGRPYFIDADNALNNARLRLTSHRTAESQSGFSGYNETQEGQERGRIKDNPEASTSKLMEALLADEDQEPIVDSVRAAFAGKTGRVVPVATGSWANMLKNLYISQKVGLATDRLPAQNTRWSTAHKLAENVPGGTPNTPEPGLRGEAGTAGGGHAYQQATEAVQIKADYDQGKIPFFTYEYDTGHVTHNGQDVWHGQTLADAIGVLLAKFPNQRNIHLG